MVSTFSTPLTTKARCTHTPNRTPPHALPPCAHSPLWSSIVAVGGGGPLASCAGTDMHTHACPRLAPRRATGMVDSGEIQRSRDEVTLRAAELKLDYTEGEAAILTASGAPLPSERVLRLTGGDSGDPLDWIELQAFGNKRWSAGLPQLVGKALTGSRLGLNLGQAQMTIMSDCMHSLATSRD